MSTLGEGCQKARSHWLQGLRVRERPFWAAIPSFRHCEFVGMPRKMFNLKDKEIVRQIGSDADVRRMEKELERH